MERYPSRIMRQNESSFEYQKRMMQNPPLGDERVYCIQTFNLGRNPTAREFEQFKRKRAEQDKPRKWRTT